LIRWVELGVAATPDGETLKLMQRGTEFSIMIGGDELMNSRRGGSETALAVVACERLREQDAPALLIGGLGMGFTLRAALAALGPRASITVAELAPEVVSWARGPLAEVFAGSLDDPRVSIVEGDVGALIAAATAAYDAILLDVDNGPDGLVRSANDRLYGEGGLHAARRALRPGGVLAIWSAAPSPPFLKRLQRVGFKAEQIMARSSAKGGARHIVWIATRP
jgi:spermidine synthase